MIYEPLAGSVSVTEMLPNAPPILDSPLFSVQNKNK
jgi:hypothetical protein